MASTNPLLMAAAGGNADVVAYLLSQGVSTTATLLHEWTALHLAVIKGHVHVARILILAGVDVQHRDEKGETAFFHACEAGNLTVVVEMVEAVTARSGPEAKKVMLETGLWDGMTPLMVAAYGGHAQVCEHLVAHGAAMFRKFTNGFDALLLAANEGHVDVVQVLVEHRCDVESTTNKNWTALMYAAKKAHVDVVRVLLGARANPNARAYDGMTALHLAAKFGHANVVKLLIQAQVDVRRESDEGSTALHIAASEGHAEVVKLLIERDPGAVQQSVHGRTALHISAERGHVDVIKLLIGAGVDVTQHDDKGFTALNFAVARGYSQAVKLLISAGAESNDIAGLFYALCTNSNISLVTTMVEAVALTSGDEATKAMLDSARPGGTTPVMIAASHGHLDLVKYLTEHGASVRLIDDSGCEALFFAANEGHVPVVDHLLEVGADIEHKMARGYTALMIAAQEGHASVVEFLWKAGANIEHKTVRGETALMIASEHGHAEVVRVLLQAGARCATQSLTGRTALFCACSVGHTDIAIALLHHKNDDVDYPRVVINLQDENGQTPLMVAVANCRPECVELLLEHGANPDLQPNGNISGGAIFSASQDGRLDNVKLLIKRGADINAEGYDGFTALMTAADSGHPKVCELLIENGADVNMQNAQGHTALHRAVTVLNMPCMRVLVKAKIDINIKDNDGLSAVYWAARIGQPGFVEYLLYSAGTTKLSDYETSPNWPLAALLEVYGEPLGDLERVDPPWFIDSSTITIAVRPVPDRVAIMTTSGTWLGSKIDIVEIVADPGSSIPRDCALPRLFVDEIDRWIPLHHPHVLRLYGACHRDRLFFVVEHTERSGLRSYLAKNPEKVWQTLHQVGLGILYLHERTLIHGGLRGDVIRVGDDGLPKVTGFGRLLQLSPKPNDHFRWRAPEILEDPTRCTLESDVYAFAMCIIEAVSGEQPYASESDNSKVKQLIKTHQKPPRHSKFTDRAWNLIERMTCERSARLTMETVVSELKMLAEEEEDSKSAHLHPTSQTSSKSTLMNWLNKGTQLYERTGVPTDLLERIKIVINESEPEGDPEQTPVVQTYSTVLERHVHDLTRLSEANTANRLAYNRQYAKAVFSLHTELDRMVEDLRITDRFTRATWRAAWRTWQRESLEDELRVISTRLDGDGSGDDETLMCLLFELKTYHLYYSTLPSQTVRQVYNKMIELLQPRSMPNWFLPSYEVNIQGYIGNGQFGKVSRGRWLDSDVVFKELTGDNAKKLGAAFVHEVSIWSKLHHPHVVKLFGASHVGKRVIVAEWAEHGELRTYLEKKKHHVWEKLYEAGLGLKYLHARGVLHCDLKGNNILVGRDRKAKLADFGLSQLSAATGNDEQRSRGNPRWTAPEVLLGAQPSQESDIFSFGMCIIEAVTGELPYREEKANAAVRHRIQERGFYHQRPDTFVSEAHWDLVLQCCHREATKRATLDQVLSLLRQFSVESQGINHGEAMNDTSADRKLVESLQATSLSPWTDHSGIPAESSDSW